MAKDIVGSDFMIVVFFFEDTQKKNVEYSDIEEVKDSCESVQDKIEFESYLTICFPIIDVDYDNFCTVSTTTTKKKDTENVDMN